MFLAILNTNDIRNCLYSPARNTNGTSILKHCKTARGYFNRKYFDELNINYKIVDINDHPLMQLIFMVCSMHDIQFLKLDNKPHCNFYGHVLELADKSDAVLLKMDMSKIINYNFQHKGHIYYMLLDYNQDEISTRISQLKEKQNKHSLLNNILWKIDTIENTTKHLNELNEKYNHKYSKLPDNISDCFDLSKLSNIHKNHTKLVCDAWDDYYNYRQSCFDFINNLIKGRVSV